MIRLHNKSEKEIYMDDFILPNPGKALHIPLDSLQWYWILYDMRTLQLLSLSNDNSMIQSPPDHQTVFFLSQMWHTSQHNPSKHYAYDAYNVKQMIFYQS